jgi:signal peptidase I
MTHKKNKRKVLRSKNLNNSSNVKSPFFSKLKSFYYYLRDSDDFLSYILNLVIAFIVIKYMIFPFLSLILATSHPLVAIVSGSMEHAYSARTTENGENIIINNQLRYALCSNEYKKNNSFINFRDFVSFDQFWEVCGNWYEQNNISQEEFKEFPYVNGFNKGDVMVIYGTKPKDIKIGDIVVFQGSTKTIIHRVVDIKTKDGEVFLTTKGDRNIDIIKGSGVFEENISEDRIIGRGVLRIPYLGWIKIFMNELFSKMLSIF